MHQKGDGLMFGCASHPNPDDIVKQSHLNILNIPCLDKFLFFFFFLSGLFLQGGCDINHAAIISIIAVTLIRFNPSGHYL